MRLTYLLTTCSVWRTHRSSAARRQLTYVVQCACIAVCRSHTTTPIQHCSSRFATIYKVTLKSCEMVQSWHTDFVKYEKTWQCCHIETLKGMLWLRPKPPCCQKLCYGSELVRHFPGSCGLHVTWRWKNHQGSCFTIENAITFAHDVIKVQMT